MQVLVAQLVPAPAQHEEVSPRRTSRLPLAIVLLLSGVVCFVVGGALAWGSNPLLGFTIGAAGTTALVVGAVLARNSLIGRFVEGGDE